MNVWGQTWYQVWLISVGLGFALLALSIAIICVLAEMNYRKKAQSLLQQQKGQK